MTRTAIGRAKRILAVALVAGILALGLAAGIDAASGGPQGAEASGVIVQGPRR